MKKNWKNLNHEFHHDHSNVADFSALSFHIYHWYLSWNMELTNPNNKSQLSSTNNNDHDQNLNHDLHPHLGQVGLLGQQALLQLPQLLAHRLQLLLLMLWNSLLVLSFQILPHNVLETSRLVLVLVLVLVLPPCCRFWSQTKATHRWFRVVVVKSSGCVENHSRHSHRRAHYHSRTAHGITGWGLTAIPLTFSTGPKVGHCPKRAHYYRAACGETGARLTVDVPRSRPSNREWPAHQALNHPPTYPSAPRQKNLPPGSQCSSIGVSPLLGGSCSALSLLL